MEDRKTTVSYELIYSKRKTLCISMERDAAVTVRAPEGTPRWQIEEFLRKKSSWIARMQEETLKRAGRRPERRFKSGERLPLFGKEYRLELRKNADAGSFRVFTERESLVIESPLEDPEKIRELLRRWYLRQAEEIFPQRAAYFASLLGLTYGKIHIREQKTRWGSCSGQGNLNFNWKLVLGPPRALDYVAAHEVCHLKYMNHGAEFWSCVKSLLPDYEIWRRWLREHGEELEL